MNHDLGKRFEISPEPNPDPQEPLQPPRSGFLKSAENRQNKGASTARGWVLLASGSISDGSDIRDGVIVWQMKQFVPGIIKEACDAADSQLLMSRASFSPPGALSAPFENKSKSPYSPGAL